MSSAQPLEIERKFLIAYPDAAWLLAQEGLRQAQIRQTYLTAEDGAEARVRRCCEGGAVSYVHTIKRAVTGMRRVEIERAITREEYEALLAQADPTRRPVEKTRYILPYAGQMLEIDVYPFWADRAILEIELACEEAPVAIPPQLRVIREVTDEAAYKNAALARQGGAGAYEKGLSG